MNYDVNDRIANFSQIVLQDAIKERDEILAEIRNIKDTKISKAELDILEEVYRYIHDEMVKVQDEYKQLLSKNIFDLKRNLLLRRDEILNLVFNEVKEKLIGYTKSEEYTPYMESLVKEAVKSIQSKEITILVKNDDLSLSELLKTAALPILCQVEPSGDIMLGGLIVNSASDHIFIDETLDTRFLAERRGFILQSGLSID
ncbi:V-type proton ATPase subunit E [bioreactor metagenome]|uniref:V-type proton ATPase subunit E n=1 Tax=bioreactor metagenome TaxID=1076179 RepID=A0A645D2I6_9ZZZZ